MGEWSVPQLWPSQTVAILASGPSLTREQCEQVRGRCRVIAVSNQGIDNDVNGVTVPAFAPWADALYAADAKWWKCYAERALKFPGLKVSIRPDAGYPEVHTLQPSDRRPFDDRPTHLVTGSNSGYQALHLAVHFGATRIVLLGYDMQDTGGKRHCFGNHPGPLNTRNPFATFLKRFGELAPALAERGIEVINCTPTTALRCFRLAPLAEVFP